MTNHPITTPLGVLRAIDELFSDPARHTAGEEARDANGNAVDPRSNYAVCWCALGAFERLSAACDGRVISNARMAVYRAIQFGSLLDTNDRLGLPAVRDAIRRAMDDPAVVGWEAKP